MRWQLVGSKLRSLFAASRPNENRSASGPLSINSPLRNFVGSGQLHSKTLGRGGLTILFAYEMSTALTGTVHPASLWAASTVATLICLDQRAGVAYRFGFGRRCTDGTAVTLRTDYEPEPALLVLPYLKADFQVAMTAHHYPALLTTRYTVAGRSVRRLIGGAESPALDSVVRDLLSLVKYSAQVGAILNTFRITLIDALRSRRTTSEPAIGGNHFHTAYRSMVG
jgi:hypothetical protein